MTDKEVIDSLKDEINRYKKDQIKSKRRNRKVISSFFDILKFLFLGKRLDREVHNVVESINREGRLTVKEVSNVFLALIHKVFKVRLVYVFLAILPSVLIYYELKEMKKQNVLLGFQNETLKEQSFLLESSRRSSLIFVMSDILKDLNKEHESSEVISNSLLGRVISSSHFSKPYRYMEGGELKNEELSPERAMLLLTLLESGFDQRFLVEKVFYKANFNGADLSYTNLNGKNVSYVQKLERSSFKGANLFRIEMEYARAMYSDFTEANLGHAVLTYGNLWGSNFSKAVLNDANLSNALLMNCNFSESYMLNVDFKGANLKDVVLDNAKVDRIDWLSYIKDSLELIGAAELKEKYVVKSVPYSNPKIYEIVQK